jgi:hypothetical protein
MPKTGCLPLWADEIQVRSNGGTLIVVGRRHRIISLQDARGKHNLLEHSKPLYLDADQDRRQDPPHVEFANATTPAALLEFVRKWGPISGPVHLTTEDVGPDGLPDSKATVGKQASITVTKLTKGYRIEIVVSENGREKSKKVIRAKGFSQKINAEFNVIVYQSLAELRKEQQIFEATARLIAELQSKAPDSKRIVDSCSRMATSIPLKVGREVLQPSRYASRLVTNGNRRDVLLAEEYLCDVLNRFPTRIYATGEGPVELPPIDNDFFGQGIKGVLYAFLRMEYLRPRGRLGLGVCCNPKCNKIFAKERRGAKYCDKNCSHKDRGLKYYYQSGRAKRLAGRRQDRAKPVV